MGVIVNDDHDIHLMTVLIVSDGINPISANRPKLVVAVCLGIIPVRIQWLIESKASNCFLPTEPYHVKDDEVGFLLSKSIQLQSDAKQTGGVLFGKAILLSSGDANRDGLPAKIVFQFLAKVSGASLLKTQAQLVKLPAPSVIIIANDDVLLPSKVLTMSNQGAVVMTGKAFMQALKLQQFQFPSHAQDSVEPNPAASESSKFMVSSSNSETKVTAKKESDSAVPAKMEEAKTINKGFANAKPANSTNREPNHASVKEGKHTTVPDANAARSSEHNEKIYKPATSLGEEYSCNNAAANAGCKTFPYMDHSFVEGSESRSTEAASYPASIQPNFHNEFIRDHASRAAQLYQEKSASVTSTFIVDNDENVQVKIPVKSVLRTVSAENKEGVIEFGLGPMCKIGDGGNVIVHKNADNDTRQLSYRDGSGKTLFRAGLNLF